MAIREINLIDPGVLVRRHMLWHLIFWAGGLIVLLALVGGYYLFQSHAALAQKSNQGVLTQMYADLELKIEEINRLQAEMNFLQQQQNALETVTVKQPFYRIIAKLTAVMNRYTWITKLDLDIGKKQDSGSHLQLTGFSRSNEDLGDFMNRLANEPMFNAVVLQVAKESKRAQTMQNAGEEMGQIQFQIKCGIAGGKIFDRITG